MTHVVAQQPTVQVSCTVAGCFGCSWSHHEREGSPRYYVGLRVPRRVARAIYRKGAA